MVVRKPFAMKKGICSSTLQDGGAVVCNFKEKLKDLGGVQRIPSGWRDRPLCHLPALPARQEFAVLFQLPAPRMISGRRGNR